MKKNKIIIIFLIIAIISFLFLFIYDKKVNINSNIEETQEEQNLDIVQNSENNIDKEENVNSKEKKEDINIRMAVIGDIMCHNSQYKDAYDSKTNTYDFSYVFKDVKEYINSADIAIGNLETTFAGKERGYSNYPRFNTPEQLAQNLKDFGIDVV